jgi:DNA replication licensing factor MCM4
MSNLTSKNPGKQDIRSKQHVLDGIHYRQDGFPEDNTQDMSSSDLKRVPINFFAKYIAYARFHCFPSISEKARDIMIQKYLEMRRMGSSRNTITASPRQLESLIRLSEALAKMRLSNIVEEYDVHEASRLIKVALHQSATDPRTGTIDMAIITTGNTSSINEKIDRLVDLFKIHINEFREMFRDGSISSERFSEEIKKRVEREMGELTSQEISMTLSRLEEAQQLAIIGNRYGKYRIKLNHTR